MATANEVAQLRRMTDVSTDDTVYTEEILASIIDSHPSIEAAAAQVWTEKAAKFAGSVDMSESGSSRSFSQLHKNALAMRDQMAAMADQSAPKAASFTVGVERV